MVFLTFDIEEFDNPMPFTKTLSFERQMEISMNGTIRLLDLVKAKQVKATFFCTANFAIHAPELIERMIAEGHEVASHGYFHDRFEIAHLRESKEVLEKLTKVPIVGFRMPNMQPVDNQALLDAGYRYNSSLNPTFLPGKYNNLNKPRRLFKERGLWQIPASVSANLRIPLFWLSLHHFPEWYYQRLCKGALRRDGYLNIYFHPWEFVDLAEPGMNLPKYVSRNSGEALITRLGRVIEVLKSCGYPFGRLMECASLFGS